MSEMAKTHRLQPKLEVIDVLSSMCLNSHARGKVILIKPPKIRTGTQDCFDPSFKVIWHREDIK